MKKLKNLCAIVFALSLCGTLNAQNLNLNLLGQLDYQQLHNSDLSDIWGYVDENGNEYALVGVNDGGLSIVDVTTPSNPQEVFFQSGPNTIWRDIKTWGDYAYTTNEAGGGLLIVDMGPLPGSTNLPVAYYDYQQGNNNNAHNLYIDENGICYIFGADRGEEGAIMLDLTQNPMAPVEVGDYDVDYVHDGVARGDTLWAAHITDGYLACVDVSNPANPVVLGTVATPADFTHNVWFSDDNQTVFTTDEVPDGYIASYDVSDPTDMTELDRIQSSPGQNVIPHNAHFMNNYVITSYYRDGITIHDVSNPANMIQVGTYDSSPLSGDGFNGCWGVYPWLPSGNIIASDIEGGLIILGANYQRGCYLEGNVTDAVTTGPLGNVQVELLATPMTDNTNIGGDYATGTAAAGTYDVAFYLPGYVPDTAYGVTLTNGQTTIVDMALQPLVPFTLSGNITDQSTGNPISGVIVSISNDDWDWTFTTNGSGDFSESNFFAGTYDIVIGHWGQVTHCADDVELDDLNSVYDMVLGTGWYDDFSLDFGWQVSGGAFVGVWERGEPVGTDYGNDFSNADVDVSGDCGDQAYVTGNGGGSAGSDDVDQSDMVLTSPSFDLSTYSDPYIHYHRWFFNAGGSSTPNDSIIVMLTDGSQTVVVDMLNPQQEYTGQGWEAQQIRVLDFIPAGSNMKIIVRTSDYQSSGFGGHLVECGFDEFYVEEGQVGITDHDGEGAEPTVYPNPFNETFEVQYELTEDVKADAAIVLYDMQGREVYRQAINTAAGQVTLDPSLNAGTYLVRVINGEEQLAPVKVTKF